MSDQTEQATLLAHADLPIPQALEDLSADFLSQVVQTRNPGVTVSGFELLDIKRYGEEMVSTSDRVKMRLEYAPGAPETLPTRLAIKMKRSCDAVLGELYANEVDFYVRLQPELNIETPVAAGGVCDKASALYYLLLEDVSLRGAVFPTALRDNDVADVRAVLDQLAKLHARFWNSPRLKTDLAWYQTHVRGSLTDMFDTLLPLVIAENVATFEPTRQIVSDLGGDVPALHRGLRTLQRHQARLPQTVLHGDCHVGNTYLLPDGTAGLLDFQLTAIGAWIHDVNYLIVTTLPAEVRRQHERMLLDYYLDRLAEAGVVEPPSREEAWLEYRRAIYWSLYVGWLPTSPVNYGDALTSENLKRTSTAFKDHDTRRLVTEVA